MLVFLPQLAAPFFEQINNEGGLTFAGSAPSSWYIAHSGEGGLTFGGEAVAVLTLTHSAEGGLIFGGEADSVPSYSVESSGGIAFAGESDALWGWIYSPEGGMVFGGEATVEVDGYAHVAAGGMVFDGASPIGIEYTPTTGAVRFHNGFRYRRLVEIAPRFDLVGFGYQILTSVDSSHVETGQDFQVEDLSENVLPFEIESYAEGTVSLWVQTDLSSTLPTYCYLYYGRATAGQEGSAFPDFEVARHDLDSFDGLSSISLGDDNLTELDSVSATAWIRLGSPLTQNRVVFSRGYNASGYGWNFSLGHDPSGRLWLTIRTVEAGEDWVTTEIYGSTRMQPATWYHVAGIFETGSKLQLYLNGQLEKEQNTTQSILVPSQSNAIGQRNGGYYYLGDVDELRLAGAVLSSEWIQSEYDPPASTIGPEQTALGFAGSADLQAGFLWSGVSGIGFGGSAIVRPSYSAVGSGGMTFAGETTQSTAGKWRGIGSIIFAGGDVAKPTLIHLGTGGVVFGGFPTFAHESQGAMTFGGRATINPTYSPSATGGLTFVSSAPSKPIFAAIGSGGVLFSGAGIDRPTYRKVGAGSVAFGGSAPLIPTFKPIGSGLSRFAGEALTRADYISSGNGGATFGGAGGKRLIVVVSAQGGMTFSGSTQPTPRYKVVGSGGMTFSGSNVPDLRFEKEGEGGLSFGSSAGLLADYLCSGAGGVTFAGAITAHKVTSFVIDETITSPWTSGEVVSDSVWGNGSIDVRGAFEGAGFVSSAFAATVRVEE